MPWATVLASILLGSAGQVLFKLGVQGTSGLGGALTSPAVLAGAACYAISTLFWLSALARLPLALAYPLLSLNFILVLLASHFLLREPVSLSQMAGMALIVSGVAALAR